MLCLDNANLSFLFGKCAGGLEVEKLGGRSWLGVVGTRLYWLALLGWWSGRLSWLEGSGSWLGELGWWSVSWVACWLKGWAGGWVVECVGARIGKRREKGGEDWISRC